MSASQPPKTPLLASNGSLASHKIGHPPKILAHRRPTLGPHPHKEMRRKGMYPLKFQEKWLERRSGRIWVKAPLQAGVKPKHEGEMLATYSQEQKRPNDLEAVPPLRSMLSQWDISFLLVCSVVRASAGWTSELRPR